MATDRTSKRTSYPGIRQLYRNGKPAGFLVSYRVRGLGQRTKTEPTLGKAKEFQASVRDPAKAQQLRALAKGRISVAEYFPIFLERRRNLAPSTLLRYEGVGQNYVEPGRLGRLPLNSVTHDDVEEWVSDLERQAVGTGTIEKSYRTVRAMFSQAVKDGKVIFNPASGIKTPDLPDREPFFMTAEQVDQVVAAASLRDRAPIYFMAYSGLRIGEASAVRLRHLDLKGKRVTVRESSAEVGGRKITGKTKSKKIRSVDLSAELCAELNAHLAAYGPRRADGTLDPDGYVFTGERGGQIRQNNWRARVFKPAALKAGVTRLGRDGRPEPPVVHDLRHTFASLAASNGWTIHEVKEALGHSDISITSKYYLHLFADDKREKAQRLGKLINPLPVEHGDAEVVPIAAGKDK